MKRKILIILVVVGFLVGCGIENEMEALATEQANFSIQMTQSLRSFENYVDQTQQAFTNLVQSTKSVLSEEQEKINETKEILRETATYQEAIIATQQVIVEKELKRNEIITKANEARQNPEVKGFDPIVDDFLLSTDISIANDSYVFKGLRYMVRGIDGVNLSSRNFYYESSDLFSLRYVIMLASFDSGKIPGTYRPFLDNSASGTWQEVVINDQSYYFRSVNSGYGVEAAFGTVIEDDCNVVIFIRDDYEEYPDNYIDYLVDTNYLLQTTSQPICGGTE